MQVMQDCIYQPNPCGVIEVTETTICWFANIRHHIGCSFRVGAQFSYTDSQQHCPASVKMNGAI